ncbi:UNVERIFIED_CONTAM: hypothetical protein FKN15_052627 [Acipenser sinensis]
MMCKLLLSCFILLSLSWNLLSHPITDSSEMAYSVQVFLLCAQCPCSVLSVPGLCSVFLLCVQCPCSVLSVPDLCSVSLLCAQCSCSVLSVPALCSVSLLCVQCSCSVLSVPALCSVSLLCVQCFCSVLSVPDLCSVSLLCAQCSCSVLSVPALCSVSLLCVQCSWSVFNVSGSTEEGHGVNSEALSPADKSYLSQSLPALLAYPSLLAEEISRDGLRTGGYMPSGAVKEVLLEKQSRLPHVTRILGNRNQFRKRGSTSECFWKYCV